MYLIRLKQGTATVLVVQGSGMAAPWEGARLESQAAGDTQVTCTMEGTAAAIETAQGSAARWLVEAARVAELSGVDAVYLEVTVASGGTTWRSKVLGGWLEVLGAGPDQRTNRTQGLRLHLKRLDYWENSTESALYISSLASGRLNSGVTIYNSWDNLESNYVNLAAADAGGDLPAPIRLEYVANVVDQGIVYAGQNLSSAPNTLNPCLQAEDGTAGTGVTKTTESDPSASHSDFARLVWSGSADTVLVKLALSTSYLQALGGWPFLPLFRVASAITAGEHFWAYWTVVYNGGSYDNLLASTKPAYLSNRAELKAASLLHLPPWAVVTGESPMGLTLELHVQADAAGSHTLDLDHVFLLPLEYWRIYRPAMDYIGGCTVKDDPYSGTVKSYGALQGYQAEGPGLWAVPGVQQRFYFLAEGSVSLAPFSCSETAVVKMYTRTRKAVL